MTGPLRPAFHEGQVLAAADLSATVSYTRNAAARHARYLHDWGIAEGLKLVTENRTDPASNARYVEVTLSPGMAIDGTGREVIVPEPVVLRESDFEEVNGADQATADLYPVFLTADDRDQTGSPKPDSCGANTAPTRVEETYQVLFGRRGDELLVADQPVSPVGSELARPPARWLILIGFVQWTAGHFTKVATKSGDVGLRYAGVRADTVAARSGTVSVRTNLAVEEGKPALVLSGDDPPRMIYGLYRGNGTVAPLMTVEANGNLKIEGSFSGRVPAGRAHAASGTATDGMVLPLPEGVTTEDVRQGRVVLHVSVTPRVLPASSFMTMHSPVEATVDSERRVHCRVRTYDLSTSPPGVEERPGAVDFLVLATGAPTNGGG